MEKREILIANNRDQSKYRIVTDATTLGELQDAIARNESVYKMMGQSWVSNPTPINISGLTFTEGITKTQLLARDSALPTNVQFKGQVTNNLVMLLTNTTKQISSGAMDRKEAYRLVKEMGLQKAIEEGEGTNYTRVKTDILEEYININTNGVPEGESVIDDVTFEEETPEEEKEEEVVNTPTEASHPDLVNMIELAAKYWSDHNALFADDLVAIGNYLMWLADVKKKKAPTISNDDIDDMIANI